MSKLYQLVAAYKEGGIAYHDLSCFAAAINIDLTVIDHPACDEQTSVINYNRSAPDQSFNILSAAQLHTTDCLGLAQRLKNTLESFQGIIEGHQYTRIKQSQPGGSRGLSVEAIKALVAIQDDVILVRSLYLDAEHLVARWFGIKYAIQGHLEYISKKIR
jgi:hypothetical protein